MEASIPSDISAPLDLSSLSELPTDLPYSAHNQVEDLYINDLQICLSENITREDVETEDVEISTCGLTPSLGKNDISNAVRKHEKEDSNLSDSSNFSSEKCISKCATFPPSGEHKSSVKDLCNKKGKQGNDKTAISVDRSYSRSMSLPLVSAIKGSRGKLGMPPQKQSVTWAPDVYDPAPTSVSHALSNKSQSHQSDSKKSGKNKQKGGGGKSSRGSRGKGKKQNLKKSAAQIHYAEVVY